MDIGFTTDGHSNTLGARKDLHTDVWKLAKVKPIGIRKEKDTNQVTTGQSP